MKAIIVGGGVGGLTTALMLHARGIDCEVFEQADTHPRARRRHQHAAACHQGAGASSGCSTGSTRSRIRTYELYLLQPLRPGDLARAARHRCRLRLSAILDPSRPAAGRDLSRRRARGSANAASIPATGSARSRRTRAASPPISSTATARMCATARGDILIGADGIHSLRARDALSERGPGALERHDAVARRARLAEIPDRPLDGDRRRHGRRSSCSIRSREGVARGPPPDQLGGDGEGRRGRRAADARRTGRGPAASRT